MKHKKRACCKQYARWLPLLANAAFIFNLEILVVGAKDHDAFDKGEDPGDVGQAEEKVKDTLSALSQIEFMDAKIAREKGQDCAFQAAKSNMLVMRKLVKCIMTNPAATAYEII